MANKKESINISLVAIIIFLCASIVFWIFKDDSGICEFLFSISIGTVGSAVATLIIFIFEYRSEKQKALREFGKNAKKIVNDLCSIPKVEPSNIKIEPQFYENRIYIPEKSPQSIALMDNNDFYFYGICRALDAYINFDFGAFEKLEDNLESIAFWSDTFKKNPYGKTHRHMSRRLFRYLRKRWESSKRCALKVNIHDPIQNIVEFQIWHYVHNEYIPFKLGLRDNAQEVLDSILLLEEELKGIPHPSVHSHTKPSEGWIAKMNNVISVYNKMISSFFTKRQQNNAWKTFHNLALNTKK